MHEVLTDGGLWLAALIAVAAGAVSFFSPCVLPLVPGYLALLGTSAAPKPAKPGASGAGLAAGASEGDADATDADVEEGAAGGAERGARAGASEGNEHVSRADNTAATQEAGEQLCGVGEMRNRDAGAAAALAAHRGAGRRHMRALSGSRRMLAGVALFVLGFTAVFVSLMTFAGSLGVWLARWEDVVTRIAGVMVIALGLVFIGLFAPLQQSRLRFSSSRAGLIGAPFLGATFAIGWTPCIGPTLALILSLSLEQASAARGAMLGAAYCVGLGLPFLLVALGFGWVAGVTGWVRRHMRKVNIAGGSLLVLIGLLMLTGLWARLLYQFEAVIGGFSTPI